MGVKDRETSPPADSIRKPLENLLLHHGTRKVLDAQLKFPLGLF